MVTEMSAKDRLHELDVQLRERGVVDVKFFFNDARKPITAVATEVADMYQAALSHRFDNLAPVGDSLR